MVAPGGYRWWYLDALSDDGRHGLTIIAFVGSVFSPYYAAARRRAPGAADPLDHCAINVALYGEHGHRWAMTERGRTAVQRDAARLAIGPSALAWDGAVLTVRIDEVTVPWPSRLRGSVRLYPSAFTGCSFALDAEGQHHWQPIAPSARVEVDLERPGLRWQGAGYLDSNHGAVPLEQGFRGWQWSRADLGAQRSLVLYDTEPCSGPATSLALQFEPNGTVRGCPVAQVAPVAPLRGTGWRMTRSTRSDAGTTARVLQTLEDAPFYARSLVESTWCGQPVKAVHESLSLQRFSHRVVQCMLPFRMPRMTR